MEGAEIMMPECLGRSGGIQNVGMLEGPNIKMTLDMCHPTAQTVTERRPDLVMWRKSGKQIHFLEMACAWDPLAEECDFKNQKKICQTGSGPYQPTPGPQGDGSTIDCMDNGTCNRSKTQFTGHEALPHFSRVWPCPGDPAGSTL